MYDLKYADIFCLQYLKEYDNHISPEMLCKKIEDKEVIIAKISDKIIGWLRYGYFWDSIPFMNMIMIDERYRGKGVGKDLVRFWEREMSDKGYKIIMTSTLSNELAQHFYRKLGYKDSGSLILEGEALEIIFTKNL
ncbi:GNAT family N-acetyltransferase [Wukongibacter baidiensis]|uniref:GNAT family N-acetyltransferase n=1 Tax=Wukongibacter baidiensis TaxID=1723361 RepID=UPI003D7F9E75